MKRTTNLLEFAALVDRLVNGFNAEDGANYRIFRIESPVFGGPVEVVLADRNRVGTRLAFTIREDGSATGLSFWQEGQI